MQVTTHKNINHCHMSFFLASSEFSRGLYTREAPNPLARPRLDSPAGPERPRGAYATEPRAGKLLAPGSVSAVSRNGTCLFGLSVVAGDMFK